MYERIPDRVGYSQGLKFISVSHVGCLIRPRIPSERTLATKVEYFEWHGVQRHLYLSEGLVSERTHRKTLVFLEAGGLLPLRTGTYAVIPSQGMRGALSWVTERLTRFYLRSNRLLFPDPRGTALLGSLLSKWEWR